MRGAHEQAVAERVVERVAVVTAVAERAEAMAVAERAEAMAVAETVVAMARCLLYEPPEGPARQKIRSLVVGVGPVACRCASWGSGRGHPNSASHTAAGTGGGSRPSRFYSGSYRER